MVTNKICILSSYISYPISSSPTFQISEIIPNLSTPNISKSAFRSPTSLHPFLKSVKHRITTTCSGVKIHHYDQFLSFQKSQRMLLKSQLEMSSIGNTPVSTAPPMTPNTEIQLAHHRRPGPVWLARALVVLESVPGSPQ